MTYCGFISRVVLLWFDVCWCYGVVRLGWCGILMQASACIRNYPEESIQHSEHGESFKSRISSTEHNMQLY